MLDIAVPAYLQEGGTYVIPGHGRVSDEADVLKFRDMLVHRSRPHRGPHQAGQDARAGAGGAPALDYDSRYGNDDGEWTSADFVEAIYTDLKARGSE